MFCVCVCECFVWEGISGWPSLLLWDISQLGGFVIETYLASGASMSSVLRPRYSYKKENLCVTLFFFKHLHSHSLDTFIACVLVILSV